MFFNRQPKPGHVYHHKLFSLYRNREMEEYLSYMSSRGRVITEIKRGIPQKFIYRITDPVKLHYGLVLCNERKLEEKTIQQLEQSGWSHICSENSLFRKQSFHVLSTKKENANRHVINVLNKEAVEQFRFRSVLSSGLPGAIFILFLLHVFLLGTTNPRLLSMFVGEKQQLR